MLTVRPAAARGTTQIGWLDSRHSFAFGDYRDPTHTNFRTLRVLNDDRVAPGQGFGSHPHRAMEIITVVLSGALAHRDSMGTGATVTAGEWQYMSAGTGVTHSEVNPSATDAVHLLQIWVLPNVRAAAPRYAQSRPPTAPDAWHLVLAPDGESAPMPIRQDARVLTATFTPGGRATYPLKPGRAAYLHLATGAATVNGIPLTAGDGAILDGEAAVEVTGVEAGVAVLFDLA